MEDSDVEHYSASILSDPGAVIGTGWAEGVVSYA